MLLQHQRCGELRSRIAAPAAEQSIATSKVLNARTGDLEHKTGQDMADATLAFAGEMKSGEPYVRVLQNNRIRTVPREQVDFELPSTEDSFSPLGNLIPFKSMVKGQRSVMGSRFITQAMPLRNAEAPLVQSGIPGETNRSFEQEYGSHMGALRSAKDGTVTRVTPDAIDVKYADGTKETHELYNNHPLNRKTFWHQTATVQPGQQFRSGDLLAKSNFTDHEGTTALGMNARVAYLPDEGYNYEDAISISESFANRMTSEHGYQHSHEWEPTDHQGKKSFVSIFPSAYKPQQLANFDDTGVVKPGTVLHYGDPIILIKGGLFDPSTIGGHGGPSGGGNRWSYIKLHTPLPNPVMEEPIRQILGLTKQQLSDVIAHKEQLGGKSGPQAISAALTAINLPRAIETARQDIASGKSTLRDKAVRRLGYLKGAEKLGTHPKGWMLDIGQGM